MLRLFVFFFLLCCFNLYSHAEVKTYHLSIDYKEVRFANGKASGTAMLVNDSLPAPTLYFKEGDKAVIHVTNKMDVDTSIHWHGILLPNFQDGVSYLTTPPILPGKTHKFEFDLKQSGTYWYHAHTRLQEQRGIYGAFVIKPELKPVEYDKELVLVLSDWTNENPHEVLRTLKRGSEWYAMKKGSALSLSEVILGGAFLSQLKLWRDKMPGMDISDVYYEAFLINGQVSAQYPAFSSGKKLRLRVVNASASTYFWLSFGGKKPLLISADGLDVVPFKNNKLLMAIAETYDFLITLPQGRSLQVRAMSQDGSGVATAVIGQGETLKAPVVPAPQPLEEIKKMAHHHSHSGHGGDPIHRSQHSGNVNSHKGGHHRDHVKHNNQSPSGHQTLPNEHNKKTKESHKGTDKFRKQRKPDNEKKNENVHETYQTKYSKSRDSTQESEQAKNPEDHESHSAHLQHGDHKKPYDKDLKKEQNQSNEPDQRHSHHSHEGHGIAHQSQSSPIKTEVHSKIDNSQSKNNKAHVSSSGHQDHVEKNQSNESDQRHSHHSHEGHGIAHGDQSNSNIQHNKERKESFLHHSIYDKLKSEAKTAFSKEHTIRHLNFKLTGNMWRYIWSINGKTLSGSDIIRINKGETLRIHLQNTTMMHHPMHLHGHFFRVLNQHGEYSPLKHTVDVPPHQTVVIEFTPEEKGDWFFHCHVLYHMKSGMSRVFRYGERNLQLADYPISYVLNADRTWYGWGEISLMTNRLNGQWDLSNTKNKIIWEGETAFYDSGEAYFKWVESQISYEYFVSDFFRLYTALELEYTSENKLLLDSAKLGFRYLLPFFIELGFSLNHHLHFDLELEYELLIFPRTEFFVEVESEIEWKKTGFFYDLEWSMGVNYQLSKRFSIRADYGNTFGLGAGLNVQL